MRPAPSPTSLLVGLAALLWTACSSPPERVLEPVARLDQRLASPAPPGDAPTFCAQGDEFRPALGCPRIFPVESNAIPSADGTSAVTVEIPRALHGGALALVPTVTAGKRTGGKGKKGRGEPPPEKTEEPEILPPTVVAQAPPRVQVPLLGSIEGAGRRVQVSAWVLPPPRQVFRTEPIAIPESATLHVATAVSKLVAVAGSGPTEFRVDAEIGGDPNGGRHEILQETIAASEGGTWHPHAADLAALAGRKVTFVLSTASQTGSDEPSVAFPVWGSPRVIAPRPREKRPNLILVSLDTVRADHVNARAADVPITPWLDRIASEGTVFREAVAPYNSTSASHMSLFTATYPVLHRVNHPAHRLADGIPTLAEILGRAGWETTAVTEDAMISAASGFARGFDLYAENRATMLRAGAVDETFARGVRWIEKHPDTLFFLFLHTYEAHAPYVPTDASLDRFPDTEGTGGKKQTRWQRMLRRYAAEIHHSDRALEKLFGELSRLGIADDTIVVVTSDHGDEFGEHGLHGHAKTVYDEVLRVPLLFWGPGRVPAGKTIEEQVSLVDVAPTLVEMLGIEAPAGLHGRSLAGSLRGESAEGDEVRFAEGLTPGPKPQRLVTARTRDHKWIWREGESEPGEIYDLRSDPGEKKPLRDPALALEGKKLIDRYLALGGGAEASPPSARALPIDDATRRKLDALGYVD